MVRLLSKRIEQQLTILFTVVGVLWVVAIADLILPLYPFAVHGIRPRTIDGLTGIVFAPFLHAGFGHLIANTIPLLVLGWLAMIRRIDDFYYASIASMLIGGAGIWLFGTPGSIHVGASTVVFGLIGFLLFRGIFDRSLGAFLISLLVGILFGGALIAAIPPQAGISWSGHFFGFVGGIIAARDRRRS